MNEKNNSAGGGELLPAQTVNVPIVTVAGVGVSRITYKGHPVVTFAMVDEVHERPDGTAGRNFRENRDRFVDGEDFIELTADEIRRQSMDDVFPPRTPKGIVLTQRGYLKLTKPMNDDRAWMVQGEMIDHYFTTSRGSLLPNFDDPIDAAKAWIAEREARQIAERTKAEIGNRREATAMATASAATRRAERLEIELDKAGSWASVKRMEKHFKPRTFDWRPLKAKAIDLGLPPRKAMDPNFGEVNTYPADAWQAVYGLEIPHGVAQ